ncbi:hypothetical protein RFI_07166 [Reticulomyxa filosa]|uniref:JmjC domain-containing protein n=1 Tax=Reticulomyxa filosa TaxID=46433 RepID=X6NVV3_RETFI|nr:hypothetical protein RFI_07166 [Reticulomyxa filosa]|eukprot:ETO29954.1 hypothetical protein RFI_07166 [Reticulomyxa filosa]
MLCLVILFFSIFKTCVCEIDPLLLHRNVSSSLFFERDELGTCYFPPFCEMDLTQCNIPKVFVDDIDNPSEFPVIIQFCRNDVNGEKDCSALYRDIIRNESGQFTWDKIISEVRSTKDYERYAALEYSHGSVYDRAQTIDIHPLKDRDRKYKKIIESIAPPSFLSEIDIFNDLIGYLTTSDSPMMGNKWVIFGTTGMMSHFCISAYFIFFFCGGAHYHFDYYLTSFWNLVLSGSKFWLLTAPYDTLKLFPNETQLKEVMNLPIYNFFNDIYPTIVHNEISVPYYHCLQEKGDMLFAPPIYYHSTINVEKPLSVSRNLITEYDYQQTFSFLTHWPSLLSEDVDTHQNVGAIQTMELCAALFHYHDGMFRSSACWNKEFLHRLNALDIDLSQGKESWNLWSKIHKKQNSQVYVDMCNNAKKHPFFSNFWV